mgnify:CR=1 FL=1|jgi:hypothetical protein
MSIQFEKYTDAIKPLGLESIIANTIVDYVLDHADEKDAVVAYNNWVETVAIPRHFPMHEQDKVKFALQQFEIYINKCNHESLVMCRDIEREMKDISKRDLARKVRKRHTDDICDIVSQN